MCSTTSRSASNTRSTACFAHADGLPLLGETPEVKGLWSAAAVWVKEARASGGALAEWMVNGESEIDLQSSDIARFYDVREVARARARRPPRASTRPTESCIPPSSGSRTGGCACRPYYERERELGAVFFEAAAGSGRTGTSPTPDCRGIRRPDQSPRGRVGVLAGGRRSSTPSTSRCATARRCSI